MSTSSKNSSAHSPQNLKKLKDGNLQSESQKMYFTQKNSSKKPIHPSNNFLNGIIKKRHLSEDFKNLESSIEIKFFQKTNEENKTENFKNKSQNIKYLDALNKIQKLEIEINLISKENDRLQYLNKFLLITQKKKEDMIASLIEENRYLVKKLVKLESKPKEKLIKNPIQISIKNARSAKNSIDSSFMKINTGNNSPFLEEKKKVFLNAVDTPENDNGNPKRSIFKKLGGKTKNYDDIISHQHILNMNLSSKAEKLLYEDNEFVTGLKAMIEEQDIFIDFVSSSDISTLVHFYDNLIGMFNEHKSLHFLIYRLKKIIKAANVMTSSLILAESIEKIVDETIEFLECDRATVFILDEKKEELWSKVAKGSDFTIKIPMNTGIVGHVVKSSKSINIIDAYSDERFNKAVDLKSNYKTRSILCTPILDISNRVTGAIQAINKNNGHFSKDDEGLLEILANIAGVILRNNLHYDEQLVFQNNLRHILKNGILLNSIYSFEELIPRAEKILKNTMNVDQSRIFLLDSTKKKLIHYCENKVIKQYDANSGIAGYTVKIHEIQSIHNAYGHHLFNGEVDIETTLPIISMPIINPENQEVLGIFEVLNPKGLQGTSDQQKSKINSVDYETLQFFNLQLSQIIINIYEWDKVRAIKE